MKFPSILFLISSILFVVSSALARDVPSNVKFCHEDMLQLDVIGHSEAKKITSNAISSAKDIGVPVSVTILDQGGNLVSFMRMQDSVLGSIDISQRKAKTAVFFGIPSENIGKLSSDGPFRSIEHTDGGLITFAGGIPIYNKDGVLLGAIGISGGTIDEDRQIAKKSIDFCN